MVGAGSIKKQEKFTQKKKERTDSQDQDFGFSTTDGLLIADTLWTMWP